MPHTIAENLARLQAAKTAIANAITAKGGTVGSGDGLEDFPTDISTISTGVDPDPINAVLEESNDDLETALGGGSSPVVTKRTVNFYDYDGTIVQSMTSAQFKSLESMPDNPTHEGLISQGWNWELSDAKAYVAKYGTLHIGQMYKNNTTNGATVLYISLKDERTTPILGLQTTIAGSTVSINWGDGSSAQSIGIATVGTTTYVQHNYATVGDYVITITVVSGDLYFTSSSASYGGDLLRRSTSPSYADRAYQNALTKIEIGTNVTIAQSAFQNYYALAEVTLSEGVTSIGKQAFQGCYMLTKISIPNSITSIADNAFANCTSLKFLSTPKTMTTLGSNVFQYCHSLTHLSLGRGLETLSASAIFYCYSLTSITVPDTVTTVGSRAFGNGYSLTTIILPDSVTSLADNVFNGCYSLSHLTIPNTLTMFKDNTFSYCYSLESIDIPNTVTSLGASVFASCYTLKNITIPDGVTSIGSNAFSSCYSLKEIPLPNELNTLNTYTFGGCYNLTSLTLPTSITVINNNLLANCYSLTTFTVHSGITDIGTSAFSNCGGLALLRFEPTTPPTVAGSNAFSNVANDCMILAPALVVNLYMDGTNYPAKATYTYIGFATYESGETLPSTTTGGTYTLTWYATTADAKAGTNPITQGNGNEVYAIATAI